VLVKVFSEFPEAEVKSIQAGVEAKLVKDGI
jgi:hypothetical protein